MYGSFDRMCGSFDGLYGSFDELHTSDIWENVGLLFVFLIFGR